MWLFVTSPTEYLHSVCLKERFQKVLVCIHVDTVSSQRYLYSSPQRLRGVECIPSGWHADVFLAHGIPLSRMALTSTHVLPTRNMSRNDFHSHSKQGAEREWKTTQISSSWSVHNRQAWHIFYKNIHFYFRGSTMDPLFLPIKYCFQSWFLGGIYYLITCTGFSLMP